MTVNAVKHILKRILRRPGNENLQVNLNAAVRFVRAQPSPILLYQMAKVGSTSVCRSLEEAGHHPLHVHCLTAKNQRAMALRYQHIKLKPTHYYVQRLVRPYLTWTPHRIQVISLVRDPIARYLGGLFQWPICRDIVADDVATMRGKIADRLSQSEVLRNGFSWFDQELKQTLGVDVFAEPFDRKNGYRMYRSPRADVLVLKLERLSELLPTIVSDFIGTPLRSVQANVGRQKRNGVRYAEMKQTLQLPASVCEAIYDHEQIRHFYAEAEIEAFTERWAESSQNEEYRGQIERSFAEILSPMSSPLGRQGWRSADVSNVTVAF